MVEYQSQSMTSVNETIARWRVHPCVIWYELTDEGRPPKSSKSNHISVAGSLGHFTSDTQKLPLLLNYTSGNDGTASVSHSWPGPSSRMSQGWWWNLGHYLTFAGNLTADQILLVIWYPHKCSSEQQSSVKIFHIFSCGAVNALYLFQPVVFLAQII